MAISFLARKRYCGYWLDTPDGTIWLLGDSQLLESHLHMKQPNVILLILLIMNGISH